jgi:hypothetical protein
VRENINLTHEELKMPRRSFSAERITILNAEYEKRTHQYGQKMKESANPNWKKQLTALVLPKP